MATTWYYYNEQGEKIEVTGGQLKGLAKVGRITPETIVETAEGKKARAGKVKGLTFAAAAQPESTLPVEPDIYGLSQSKPVEKNPFTAAPVTAEVNPFTASTPSMVNGATPQRIPAPSVEINTSDGTQASNNSFRNLLKIKPTPLQSVMLVVIGIPVSVLIMLVVVWSFDGLAGWSYKKWGGERISFTADEQRQIDGFIAEHGRNVRTRDSDGETLLHIATRSGGNVAIVKYLLSRGADVRATDNSGVTPLHNAASVDRDGEMVELLISKRADLNATVSFNGGTPLHYAASAGQTKAVQLLVAAGANSHARCNEGRTPLDWARDRRDESRRNVVAESNPAIRSTLTERAMRTNEVVEYLSETTGVGNAATAQNAAPQARPQQNVTQPTRADRDEIDRIDQFGNTALHRAAGDGNLVEIRNLIANGANVNARNRNGETPLHSATASNDNVEVIKFLVANGADVNAQDEWGGMPFFIMRNVEIAEFILSQGFDVNTKCERGRTPLHVAVFNDNAEVVKFLIANGADVNAQDEEGTPLHLALLERNVEIAKFLITQGADVNAKDVDGMSSLAYAVNNNAFEIVRLLVSEGADVNFKTAKVPGIPDGITPLHFAAANGSVEVARFLVSEGADVNVRNSEGHTPLNVARMRNNTAMVQYLISAGAR